MPRTGDAAQRVDGLGQRKLLADESVDKAAAADFAAGGVPEHDSPARELG